MAEPRSLVDELRRVDDAFSQLKPARDDVVEGLLAGDVELLIAHGNRGLRAGRVRQALAVAGLAAAMAVVVFAVAPRPDPTTTTSTTPTAVAVVTPSPLPASPAMPVTPTVTPSSSASASPSPAAPSSLTLRAMTPTSAPQTPAMRIVPTETAVPVSPSSSSWVPLRGIPHDIDVPVEGIAVVAPDVVRDDDVDTALVSARGLAARGAHAEAAAVLQALLARGPGARIVDVVSSEQASLLAKAGQVAAACAVWSTHRERFATSDNSAAVVAALARYRCP